MIHSMFLLLSKRRIKIKFVLYLIFTSIFRCATTNSFHPIKNYLKNLSFNIIGLNISNILLKQIPSFKQLFKLLRQNAIGTIFVIVVVVVVVVVVAVVVVVVAVVVVVVEVVDIRDVSQRIPANKRLEFCFQI